jgi:capsular polysaccharide transport system ATP-binding protein
MADIRQYCNLVVLVDRGNTVLFEDVEAGIRSYQGAAGNT